MFQFKIANPFSRMLSILVFFAIGIVGLKYFAPNQYRVFRHNFSNINDYLIFDNHEFSSSSTPKQLKMASKETQNIVYQKLVGAGIDILLTDSDNLAFIIFKNDEIVFEQYWQGHTKEQKILVYSVTKSIVSLLVGAAIDDGLISSVDQPVGDFIDHFKQSEFKSLKIKHLLQMTSGLPYQEQTINNPFGLHAHLTYTNDIKSLINTVKPGAQPGKTFVYKSIDYAILGLILQTVLKEERLTHYFYRKFWDNLNSKYPGSWSIDSKQNSLAKTWCCLALTARDLGRFGLLLQHNGVWENKRLISEQWLKQSIYKKKSQQSHYHYGWWLMPNDSFGFRAEGILGQFLYINPKENIVIVRYGKSLGKQNWVEWKSLFESIVKLLNTHNV